MSPRVNKEHSFIIKKVAIYIRVSTEEQAKEGYSISAQKQRLKAFCIAQDWAVADMYVDEGISAKNMNRPDLQRMIKDIEAGKIDCVLVYRLDRLTRSVFDLYKLLETFDKYNCKFKSATEVYDTTTAMGRMFITIVAALAQWERENMGERISMGLTEKVRQGKYALTFRPFGYNLDLKTGKLSIKDDEAKIVRLIYKLYFDGYGANKVCKYLNERNIPTRDGNKWNDKPLIQIIKNPLYYGAIRWQDFVVENTHEPIISKEEFESAQVLIDNRRTTEPRRISSKYIFSGKLKCNSCGHPMRGFYTSDRTKTKKYRQYRCMKKKIGECVGSRSISERKLENALIEYIGQEDFSEVFDQAAATAETILNENQKSPTVDINSIEKELDKIDRRKKKWQYAWSEDLISDDDFRKRMDEANNEEATIKAKLTTIEIIEEEPYYDKNEIFNALKDIKQNWNQLEVMEKKSLVDSIIQEIQYEYDGSHLMVRSIDFI